MEKVRITTMRRRVSWGSIFGGVVTVLAISILLSILASSIGLFQLDPQSDHPASGIGVTVGIFTVISLIVSFTIGGFVAGKLAGADGMIHGFLVWATTMIVAVILGTLLVGKAVKATANVLGAVSSVTGHIVSGVGSMVGSGVSELADQAQNVFGDIDFDSDVNGREVRQDIRQALRKSGVRELQPEYLRMQMRSVKNDFNRSLKRLVTNPKDADMIINNFGDRLSTRVDNITKNIDRDDLTRAIANNSSLSKAEVDKAVDEYIDIINQVKEESKEQIDNLQQSIDEAKQNWEEMKQNALREAEKVSNAAARSALWSFIAMLIGAILCAVGGSFGTKKTKEGYEA